MTFIIAYLILKFKHPEKPWMFPWISGWRAILFTIPPFSCSALMSILTLVYDVPYKSVPRINTVTFSVVIGIGIILHVALVYLGRNKSIQAIVTSGIELEEQSEPVHQPNVHTSPSEASLTSYSPLFSTV